MKTCDRDGYLTASTGLCEMSEGVPEAVSAGLEGEELVAFNGINQH
ncbi:hypothetical protein [uncultured Cohaesibacter sp.]|nr:hypothetical protein [uncultured Cohaesibacter sp.]